MAGKSKKGTRGARSRRGKSEDMTGAKEGTTEVRTGQVELAMPAPDRQLHYFDSIKHELAMVAKANERVKKLKKAAESENCDVPAIMATLKLEKGDVVKYRRQYEQQAVLMKAKGIPFQMSIFDISFKNPVDQAVFEARAQANAGRTFECRFPEGSDEHEAAIKEWTRINAERVPGGDDLSEDEIDEALSAPRSAPAQRELEGVH